MLLTIVCGVPQIAPSFLFVGIRLVLFAKKYFTLTLAFYLTCTPLMADYASAFKAYQAGEFNTAFDEYQRMAKLGDPDAQKNLAAMYARGEAVSQNWIEAYAWAALNPAKNGEPNQIALIAKKKLSPTALGEAEQLANNYQTQYSTKAIEESLLPVALIREADCTVENTPDAIPVSTVPPRYPSDAAMRGIMAVVSTEMLVGKNGYPAYIYITSVQTNYAGEKQKYEQQLEKQFSDVTLVALRKWKFKPLVAGKFSERPYRFSLDFMLDGQTASVISSNIGAFKSKLTELNERAQNKDALAQYELASYYEHNGPLYLVGKKPEYKAFREKLYLNSAINGSSASQFKLAKKLLAGDQCAKDERKGLFWLSLAAQGGDPDARFAMAWRLYHGDGVATDTEKAMFWLAKAAESGHPEAQLRYGLIKAQDNSANMDHLKDMYQLHKNNDSFMMMELKALAAAWANDWEIAEELQQKIISIAQEAEFDLSYRNAVLQQIQAKQKPKFETLL